DLERVYPRYGFPNDILVHLNVWNARVRDVPSRPVYGVGERSGIKIPRVVPRISWLLVKGFFWRMQEKYVIRVFHPLVFFYAFGGALRRIGGVALIRLVRHGADRGSLTEVVDVAHPCWDEDVVYAYCVTIRPGRIKGWGMHKLQSDRYFLVAGSVRVVLYDGR